MNVFTGFAPFELCDVISSIIGGGASRNASKDQERSINAAKSAQQSNYDDIAQRQSTYAGNGTAAETTLAKLLGTWNGQDWTDDNGQGREVLALNPSLRNQSNNSASWQNAVAQIQANNIASAKASDPTYGSLLKPFSSTDFTADPGYQFALQQGQLALQRTQAANGGLNSGSAAKAMNAYTQGVAAQQYGSAYDRYNTNQTNTFNRLTGQVQVGQNANAALASAGTNNANAQSNLDQSYGNAQASNDIAQGNAWTTGINSIKQGIMAAATGGTSSFGSNLFTGSTGNGWYPTQGLANQAFTNSGGRWNN